VGPETVLAVRASELRHQVGGTGFHNLAGAEIMSTLQAAGVWFGPRAELEYDESFRQVVPYVVLRRADSVVSYLRSATGTESRLHGLRSLGVGGHVNLGDVVHDDHHLNLGRTLEAAAGREVAEEVGDVAVIGRRWVGILMSDSNAVSRVHVGVVAVWVLGDGGAIEPADRSVVDVTLVAPQRLDVSAYETWSAMLLTSGSAILEG